MNKSQQVEFCLRTAIFLKREAEEAICNRDDVADIHYLFKCIQATAGSFHRVEMEMGLTRPDNMSDFTAPLKQLVALRVDLEKMISAAWPHGDEGEQVARLYLRLYCVMLEKPEPLLAL